MMTIYEAREYLDSLKSEQSNIQSHMNWTTDKPVFTEDCVLVTADGNEKDGYTYNIWLIEWSKQHGYWMWLNNNFEEYADIEELQADKYLILPKI